MILMCVNDGPFLKKKENRDSATMKNTFSISKQKTYDIEVFLLVINILLNSGSVLGSGLKELL